MKESSSEDIADLLIALSKERPGLAYDVGVRLIGMGASRTFPGPPPGWYSTEDRFYVMVDGYDLGRQKQIIALLYEMIPSAGPRLTRQSSAHRFDRNTWFASIPAKDPVGPWVTRQGAEARVEAWVGHGVYAHIVREVEPMPEAHERTLRDLILK